MYPFMSFCVFAFSSFKFFKISMDKIDKQNTNTDYHIYCKIADNILLELLKHHSYLLINSTTTFVKYSYF